MSTIKTTPQANRKKKSKALLPPPTDQAATPAILPVPHRDDLTNIEGIDAAIEMALNSIGIRQFLDFRGYTSETLAQLLQARTGLPIEATTIASQDWMGWAEILAAENISSVASETDEEKATEQATENTPVETPLAAKSEEKLPQPPSEADRESSLKQAAAQNLAHEDERSATAPVEEATIKKQKAVAPTAKPNGAKVDLALHIQNAKFVPLEMPAQPNITSVKTLRSEIHCTLSGVKALAATIDGLPLCAQIHAVDTLTGEYKLLASQAEPLLPDQTDYRMQLEFEVPRHGRYQLQVITFLLGAEPKIAFYQGPILRVIA